MKRVILETPYKGKDWVDTEENLRFARLCMHDCFKRGEAPYASHLLYTQPHVLDDKVLEERRLGMEAGFVYKAVGELTVVYINRGLSRGMLEGIKRSVAMGQPIEYRTLPDYHRHFAKPAICTVSGASGAGKTSVLKLLLDKRPDLRFIKSFTSRTRRTSDRPGEYRYNQPAEKFERQRNRFLWVQEAHGNFYGTHKVSVTAAFKPLASKAYPRLMTIVPECVPLLRSRLSAQFNEPEPPVASFYLLSPGEDELRRRLVARGDSEPDIERRVAECQAWDKAALASDTPFIFIPNGAGESNAANMVAQLSLFI